MLPINMLQPKTLLLVGDPHATVEEIPDCNRLITCVIDALRKKPAHGVVFLGDLHHNHALVRIEVMEFWRGAFKKIKTEFPELRIFALVGNHDRSHDYSVKANALQSYDIEVIEKPTEIVNGVVLAPWYPDPETFLKTMEGRTGKTLICHQTFDGSKYENGFYASDGVKPGAVQFETIFSGHIHTPQQFANVWYIGAPRWRIASDANIPRFLWSVDFDGWGAVAGKQLFATDDYCRPLWHLVDKEEDQLVVKNGGKGILRVDVHGSAAWVDARKAEWEAVGARVATFPIVARSSVVKESEGIPTALSKFVDGWVPKFGTPIEQLKQMVAERINV